MAVQTSTADFEPAAFIIMQKRSMFLAAQLAAAREGQNWDEAVNAFTGFSESFKKDDCKV